MLYPLPAVMVTTADHQGNYNIFTVAWAGTVCSDPPMVSISVRPSRHSWSMIRETGDFVVNMTTESLTFAADYCGVVSGRDVDKFQKMRLTPLPAEHVAAPLLKESPVNLECKVEQVLSLGTHDMFIARVVAVHVDEEYLDEKQKFHLNQAAPVVYSHGSYLGVGKEIGTFGYSVRKKDPVTTTEKHAHSREKKQEKPFKRTGKKTQKPGEPAKKSRYTPEYSGEKSENKRSSRKNVSGKGQSRKRK